MDKHLLVISVTMTHVRGDGTTLLEFGEAVHELVVSLPAVRDYNADSVWATIKSRIEEDLAEVGIVEYEK